MEPSGSQGCHYASPVGSLNALAAHFDPQSCIAYGSSSMHRANSFSFERKRNVSAILLSQGLRFGRRTSSDCFLDTNPTVQVPLQGNGNSGLATTGTYDPFVTATTPLSAAAAVDPVQANPYSQDTAAALGGAAFFGGQSGFQQPVRNSTWRLLFHI